MIISKRMSQKLKSQWSNHFPQMELVGSDKLRRILLRSQISKEIFLIFNQWLTGQTIWCRDMHHNILILLISTQVQQYNTLIQMQVSPIIWIKILTLLKEVRVIEWILWGQHFQQFKIMDSQITIGLFHHTGLQFNTLKKNQQLITQLC